MEKHHDPGRPWIRMDKELESDYGSDWHSEEESYWEDYAWKKLPELPIEKELPPSHDYR